MAKLKSRNNFPIGGWIFHQPETGWSANPHVGFTDVVEQIIKHRTANPRFKLSVNREHVEWELEQFTIQRMLSLPTGKEYVVNASGPPPPAPNFQLPPRPRKAAVAGGVEKAKAGASLIAEWLGDGLTATDHDEAEKRAEICAVCPKNKAPNILQKTYSVLAGGIALLLEAKNSMKLSTSKDAELHTCTACDCDLKLKVHTPIAHVLANTPPDVRADLDPSCWILKA